MKLLQNIVNEKLIATGKGGDQEDAPWVTLVFDVKKDELLDLTYYDNEDDAVRGHVVQMVKEER